jgi:multisubunit Na+/H+ antiporter MnhG subunit
VTSIAHWVAAGVLGLSVLGAMCASLAAVWVRDAPTRLHYPGIVGSVSGPLLALAVLFDAGPGMTTLTVVATVVVLAFTGPVLTAAIGKLNAPREIRSVGGSGEGER